MDKMNEMHDKFLVLAEKLGVTPDLISKIKEGFEKGESEVKVTTIEVEKEPEDAPTINTAKSIEMKMPSEEDISKMSLEELKVLAKMLISKNLEKENKSSPFMEMIKKNGY